jgi:WD40 repeat protein
MQSYQDAEDGDLTVTFSPNGEILATGGGYDAIKLWYVSDASLAQQVKVRFSSSNVVFSPKGDTFIAGLWNGKVRNWKISNGKAINSSAAKVVR